MVLGTLLVASACAPERDVVATEVAADSTAPTLCQKTLRDVSTPLALWDFEAEGVSIFADSVRGRDAQVVGAAAERVLGPDGCGSALAFGNDERYLLIEDADDWTLQQGSVDAWFWVPAAIEAPLGLVSRDQYGDSVGHFSVWLMPGSTVLARLQQSDAAALREVLSLYCSAQPLPAESWAHIGFNFGAAGAALYVNGQLAAATGAPGLALGDVMCGDRVQSASLPDLPLPWVVGSSTYASRNIPADRQHPYRSGAVDNFRISSVERDFRALFEP